MANLSVRRGDTAVWQLAFTDNAGATQNLAGLTVWWTVKPVPPASAAADLDDASALVKAWWQHNGTAVVAAAVVDGSGTAAGNVVATDVTGGVLELTLW